MEKLTDDSIMPFGRYRGLQMKQVDCHWLLWLYHRKRTLDNMQVWDYVKDNLKAIESRCTQKMNNTL